MKSAAILTISALVLFAFCAGLCAAQFPDVPTDHWAYSAVQGLVDKGIINGYPSGTFQGKRALTRYEFGEALAKAIPVIAGMANPTTGVPGPQGARGEVGPVGPSGITATELENFRKLIDEFKDELSAQGIDIQAVKKDLSTLAVRIAAAEAEQNHVKITAEVPLAGRSGIQNGVSQAFDKDSRRIGINGSNLLQNNRWFDDLELGIKGKISGSAYVNALIAGGNYLPFALSSSRSSDNTTISEFNLFNLYLHAAVNLGSLGGAQATVGRFPFQLTPLTLRFVNPDSYIYVNKLQTGDYALDGGSLAFRFGQANITAFAADSVAGLGNDMPALQFGSGISVSQLAGARAVLGAPSSSNLGLTYYQVGPAAGDGQLQVYGADVKASIYKVGVSGEYAANKPSSFMQTIGGVPDTSNQAWNANLTYHHGDLGISGGYTDVGTNYIAPGYWSRLGRAVNLQNVKGPVANVSYAISPKLVLSADGQFLQPKDGDSVFARNAIDPSVAVSPANVNKVTGWKAGLKYSLTSSNAVDVGWEETLWQPLSGDDTRERYYTIGLGHSFNSSASLKVLYQIVDYKLGAVDVYGDSTYRGGVATAQFQLKY